MRGLTRDIHLTSRPKVAMVNSEREASQNFFTMASYCSKDEDKEPRHECKASADAEMQLGVHIVKG